MLFLCLEQEAGPFPGTSVSHVAGCLCRAVCQPGFPLNDSAQTAEIQRISPADRVFLGLFAQGLGAVAAPDWPGSLLVPGDVSPFAMPWWDSGSVAGLCCGVRQCFVFATGLKGEGRKPHVS